jgi:hypothetical protein
LEKSSIIFVENMGRRFISLLFELGKPDSHGRRWHCFGCDTKLGKDRTNEVMWSHLNASHRYDSVLNNTQPNE